MELSKKDKKTAREIIESGLQQEFAKALFDVDTILTGWKNKSKNNRDAYHSLYKLIPIPPSDTVRTFQPV